MNRIFVLGADGQVEKELRKIQIKILFILIKKIDITDEIKY